MLRSLFLLLPLLTACASAPTSATFSNDDFLQLRFLEGRWQGTAPSGGLFYEEYRFPSADVMRVGRFDDASFAAELDHSLVILDDGHVYSLWNEYKWEAIELSASGACFIPLNTISTYCWKRISADEVHVTQSYPATKDDPGHYKIPMRRL